MTSALETEQLRVSSRSERRRHEKHTRTDSDPRLDAGRRRRDLGKKKVAPEGMRASKVSNKAERKQFRRSNSKKLHVDTANTGEGDANGTGRTARTTPSPQTQVRSASNDLRSPGQRKSPVANVKVASQNDPLPDFITQTDKYGNASTPRSSTAIDKARKVHPSGPQPHLHVTRNGKLSEEEELNKVDACTETLMDSIRLMCCCLAPEESHPKPTQTQTRDEEEEDEFEDAETDRPRLLPAIHSDDKGKKCLVLDLDETLVHSSFRAVSGADFVIPVQIEDVVHFVYVTKRPGVDEFLVEMAKHYEIVIYTASLNKYADPLLDLLDPHQTIRTRLFRESCVYYEGNYVKDLSLLDRDLKHAIIVDNSPSSYIFHPENAIDCSSFIDDPNDRELDQIAAFLKGVKNVRDIRGVAPRWREWPKLQLNEQ